MQEVMAGMTRGVGRVTGFALEQCGKFTGKSVSDLTKETAASFTSRGFVLVSSVALACFVPYPLVAVAATVVAVYAFLDCIRVADTWNQVKQAKSLHPGIVSHDDARVLQFRDRMNLVKKVEPVIDWMEEIYTQRIFALFGK